MVTMTREQILSLLCAVWAYSWHVLPRLRGCFVVGSYGEVGVASSETENDNDIDQVCRICVTSNQIWPAVPFMLSSSIMVAHGAVQGHLAWHL